MTHGLFSHDSNGTGFSHLSAAAMSAILILLFLLGVVVARPPLSDDELRSIQPVAIEYFDDLITPWLINSTKLKENLIEVTGQSSAEMFPLHSLQFSLMECLYEDEFVLLTPARLVIKNFRFPNKKCKIINMELISVLWFEPQETCKLKDVKAWGKSKSQIYWALDVKRCLRGSQGYNIVIDINQTLRFGFSVFDGVRFMEAMRDILDYHVIVVDKINI